MAFHGCWTPESVVGGKWVTPESEKKRQKERKKKALKKMKEEERIRKKHRAERKEKAAKIKAKQEKAAQMRFWQLFGCMCCVACSCVSIVGASVFLMYAF